MPLISLIVALVMRSSEQAAKRRGFLKNWAVASGAWMCTGWLLLLLVFTSAGGFAGGGGCKGGPDPQVQRRSDHVPLQHNLALCPRSTTTDLRGCVGFAGKIWATNV
jgi:hypothetical protein